MDVDDFYTYIRAPDSYKKRKKTVRIKKKEQKDWRHFFQPNRGSCGVARVKSEGQLTQNVSCIEGKWRWR